MKEIKQNYCVGWGRKPSGKKAVINSQRNGSPFLLMEDGFIRSVGLGDSPAFSVVEDDIGIYYDSTSPSRLENLLNYYNFSSNGDLLKQARNAIDLIQKYKISKYNHAPDVEPTCFGNSDIGKVLIIAQTKGDLSLRYGLTDQYSTDQMIDAATQENPGSQIYLKVHPDVLNGKKKSDVDIESADTKYTIISEDVNPISLLKHFDKVYTKTSQMGFEALLTGCECVCFGMPFYAGWGLTDDRVQCGRRKRRLSIEEVFAASYILYPKYFNPYSQNPSDIIDTIKTIVRYRDIERYSKKHVYLFGFSRWKHGYITSFLKQFSKKNTRFINPILSSHMALSSRKGLDKSSEIYIWGAKRFPEIEEFAEINNIKVTRVEDGFIRSVGLGSDLTRPYSLIFDDIGIYFDSSRPSRLENLLNTYEFDSHVLAESAQLKNRIVEYGISKYNGKSKSVNGLIDKGKSILVVGQVEDDASIRLGSDGMTNLSLLQQVKSNNPDAFIVYKPHPDVVSGNRVGDLSDFTTDLYSDLCLTDVDIGELISRVDEVHTITSLVGFEALIRGKKVVTYGIPFYAGWGLTYDKKSCNRRSRNLTIDELIAGVLILYPRYIDPESGQFCSSEILVSRLKKEKDFLNRSSLYRMREKSYNFISRSIQKIYRWIW